MLKHLLILKIWKVFDWKREQLNGILTTEPLSWFDISYGA